MARRYLSCGRRDEGKGRIRITGRGRIAGSQNDRQVAEKALHAKSKIKLTPAQPLLGSCSIMGERRNFPGPLVAATKGHERVKATASRTPPLQGVLRRKMQHHRVRKGRIFNGRNG